jgi:hypothetical protein
MTISSVMGSSRPQSSCRMSQTRWKASRMASICSGSTLNFENGMATPMACSRLRGVFGMACGTVNTPCPPIRINAFS